VSAAIAPVACSRCSTLFEPVGANHVHGGTCPRCSAEPVSRCAVCLSTYTLQQFMELSYRGFYRPRDQQDPSLLLCDCACGNTLSLEVPRDFKLPEVA
jgi:hypothetical protein